MSRRIGAPDLNGFIYVWRTYDPLSVISLDSWHPTSPTQCGHLSPEKALPGEQKCLLCPAIVSLPFQSQSGHLMAPANWGPDVGCIHIGIFLHTNSDTLRLSSEFSSIRPLNSFEFTASWMQNPMPLATAGVLHPPAVKLASPGNLLQVSNPSGARSALNL